MAVAQIGYRDQIFTFPAIDDIERLEPRQISDLRRGFSTNGVPETFQVLPYETVTIGVPDVVEEDTLAEIEAFWSHARRGYPFSFAFDSEDRVLTALEEDVPAGSRYLLLSGIGGIKIGGRYFLMQDLLGRNTSRNLLPEAQSKSDSPSDYVLTGNVSGQAVSIPVIVAGSNLVRYNALAANAVIGASIPTDTIQGERFVTASVWYANATPGSWRLYINADGVAYYGPTIPTPTGTLGMLNRASVTAFLPNGASVLSLNVQSLVAGSVWITLDGWQVEMKQHPTPWIVGGAASEASSAGDGFHEIVEIKRVGFSREARGTFVELTEPTKFPYLKRDALRSRRYWERLTAIQDEGPLALKSITSTFRQRCREIA